MGTLGLLTSAGCLRPERPVGEQLDRGCVFILPGVNNRASQFTSTVMGLRDAGLDQAAQVIEWGDGPLSALSNLTSLSKNLQRADDIASQIIEYQQAYPGRPTSLVGFSGGGGLAVLAARALPPGIQVDRLVLVGAALAPDYDLAEVLPSSREGIVNFYSPRDWLVLGIGTEWFGTIDRRFTQSAGRAGFLAEDGSLFASAEVWQIGWQPAWRTLGHSGGHAGWMSREWARVVLAPAIDPSLAPKDAG
jgi:pimeloyl-ACP methyl ester carboxylesterase